MNSWLELNLWDFPFRRLSSSQGRWISPDPSGVAAVNPMNPQSWNRYAYVLNNPLALIDPLGLDSCPPPGENNGGDDDNQNCDGGWPPPYCSEDGTICGGVGDPSDYSPSDVIDMSNNVVIEMYGVGTLIEDIPTDAASLFLLVYFGGVGGGGGSASNMVMTSYFLPQTAVPCSASTGVTFYAPPKFSVSNIAANGATNGWSGKEAAVGQFGYYDYQRYVTGPGTFNFYYGYTPVANIAVGAYLQGAGYAWAAGAISNTYAMLHSANGATAQQAQFRNLGIALASGKAAYTCLPHP